MQPDPFYQNSITTTHTVFDNNSFGLKYSPRPLNQLTTTTLLGKIRIRQLRVQVNKGCKVSSYFSHIFPNCKGVYKQAYHSEEKYISSETARALSTSRRITVRRNNIVDLNTSGRCATKCITVRTPIMRTREWK
jgi:hypothetical protein